jgi:hypothetical protein
VSHDNASRRSYARPGNDLAAAREPPPSMREGISASSCALRDKQQWPGCARGGVLVREDGRCPARTGDLLLVRREQLLRSPAVCRSFRSASDELRRAAAVCCGLPLPSRFHVVAPALTRKQEPDPLAARLSRRV